MSKENTQEQAQISSSFLTQNLHIILIWLHKFFPNPSPNFLKKLAIFGYTSNN